VTARRLKRAALRSLRAVAPLLLASLENSRPAPLAGVVTVLAACTACAVMPRAAAIELMRAAGGFDTAELARVESPSPPSALPVVLLGMVRGTARLLTVARERGAA
jgi:hypothetical protein